MRSGHGAHPRGRHGRGEDAVLGNSLPPVGGEGVLRAGGKARAAVSGGGVHLVVVEGLAPRKHTIINARNLVWMAEPCAGVINNVSSRALRL